MALNLVAYDASDNESDVEDDSNEDTQSQVQVVKKTISTGSVSSVARIDAEDVGDVPKPSEKELQLAELARKEKANLPKLDQLSQLTSKKNGRIVIGIPSLSEFDEDDEAENVKKVKKQLIIPSKGQSKLFSKLPAPRNSAYEPPSMETDSSNKTEKPSFLKKSTSLIPHSVTKKKNAKRDSDDEDGAGSFFTLDEPELKPTAEAYNVMETVMPGTAASAGLVHQPVEASYYSLPTNEQYNMANIEPIHSGGAVGVPEDSEMDVELDETALQALQGTKRKLPDDAQIIEIRGERLSFDPSNSYLKSISEERSAHNSEDFQYNKVQKKKHQITYLAAQAKAREVDLKNQWAQNKMSRKHTQQKYGF